MRTSGLRLLLVKLLAVAIAAVAFVAVDAEAQYFRFGKNKIQYHDLDWHFVQSIHFDVYYYEPDGEALATFTAHAAEEAYADIERLFGHRITDRIAILVYKGHNEFAVTNAVDLPDFAEGIGGVTELYKNRVALPFTGDLRNYRRVLHHELVHAVVNDMFYGGSLQRIIRSGTRLRLPVWFHEGLAEYSALGWDTNSDMFLREAIAGDRLPPIDGLYGYVAYRGGQGVFDYIAAQYGRETITEILHRTQAGGSVSGAIQSALGVDIDQLSERWHQALRAVHFPEVAAREELDAIARPLLPREEGLRFSTSAAISPRGDRVAFLSADGGTFDVYLVDADGGNLRRLIAGQTNPQFESFRILTPGLSWNPSGTRLAVAVKAGATDAIALVDVETLHTRHYRIPTLDAIQSVQWSPDGSRIAMSATRGGQSDIYVLDLQSGEVVNHTNDAFSDAEPSWSRDGRFLVFHSDRGDHLVPGSEQGGAFDLAEYDYGQFSLYRMDLEAPSTLTRLTHDPNWDDTSPRFGEDADRLLFISDRNGVPNLYELQLATGTIRPLTDLFVGVTQVSLSMDGRSAALVTLKEGLPAIYLLREPFEREIDGPLAPTVWAQRVMGDRGVGRAPALAVAHPTTLQDNPFLREAGSSRPFVADLMRRKRLGNRLGSDPLPASSPPVNVDSIAHAPSTDTLSQIATDASETGPVDFREYDFSDAFDEASPRPSRFEPLDNVRADGSFRPRRYRLRFSPDLIYGNLGYDAIFGVQSFTQISFSDLLGNHRISAATNLVIDLRNSDYLLSYQHLTRRTNYALTGFHVARQLSDFDQQAFYRYRNYGAIVGLSYPLDKFRRIEAEISLQGVDLTDLMDPTLPSNSRGFVFPALTFTSDHTTPGFLTPSGGRRFAVRVSGTPGPAVAFGSVLADARQYFGGRAYSLGLRVAAGASFGRDAQRYYSAGVQNWLNPEFSGIPIRDENDFVFGTPIMPLRGHEFDAASGDRFVLFNAEVRVPLVAALLPGPLPVLPLYHLQGVAFIDAAVIPSDDQFSLWADTEDSRRELEDLYLGAGVGLRTLVLGYPLRLDWAWPHDGYRFGPSRFYVSVGLDF